MEDATQPGLGRLIRTPRADFYLIHRSTRMTKSFACAFLAVGVSLAVAYAQQRSPPQLRTAGSCSIASAKAAETWSSQAWSEA